MTLALALTDARGPDPTGTAGIRRSFRAAGKMRMNMFRSAMRQAVVEHDVLGLGGAGLSMQPPETRLQAFNGWARVAAGRALGGPWLSEWIARAWASGEATGALQARSQAPGEGSGAWSELAKVELDAIAFAVVQVITREAAIALTKRRSNKVMVWRRMAKAFDKVGPPRVMALANTFCVVCHNQGRIAAYRAAGITKVGVIPERLLPKQALLLPGGGLDSFNPDQPRGWHGQWSPAGEGEGGAGGGGEGEKLDPKIIEAVREFDRLRDTTKLGIMAVRREVFKKTGVKLSRGFNFTPYNAYRSIREDSFDTTDAVHKGYRERAAARPEYELSEIEEPIKIGVRTAGDEFVCQACEEFAAGSPYDIDEVEDTLPMHVSCRCTWFPWEDQRYSRDDAIADAVPKQSERELMLERLMRRRHRALARMAPRKFRKPWKDEFDPGQPRDPDGKWTGAGGGSAGGDGHPGKGYSASARTIRGVIHTDNVHDAQRALFENRKVELSQLKQVSTLVDLLGETAAKMEAAGEKAPLFNLCNVSITGTNLFCAESKGIPRVEMPVIRAKKTKEFVKYLKSRGYKTEKSTERADHLRSTQDQIDGAKVAANMKRIDKEGFYKRIVVSRDDYILDGHHTWAGQLGVDARDGSLKGDKTVRITRVDISITKLLAEAETWTGGAGKKAAGQDSWDPNQPRDPDGKWAGGGGEAAADPATRDIRTSLPVAAGAELRRVYDLANKQADARGELARAANSYPIKSVPIASMVATQPGLNSSTVEKYRAEGFASAPEALEYGGHFYITQGHHRVEAAKRAGKTHLDVHVQPVRGSGKLRDAFNPLQPREPAGSPEGGQFASITGGGISGGATGGPVGAKTPVWKPSQTLVEHRKRVEGFINKPALRNSRFRYQAGKLIDEMKGSYSDASYSHHGSGVTVGPSDAITHMQQKIGESFWQQAALKIKKAGGETAETKKMFAQAEKHGFTPNSAELQSIESLVGKVGSVTIKAKATGVAQPAFTPQPVAPEPSVEPAATIPVATPAWTKLGPQKGSVSGGMYGDPQGNSWYVKTPKTEQHVNADMLANSLYKLAGVNVAHQVKTQLDGKPAVASLYVQNTDTLAGQSGEAKQNAQKMLREHFAVDAWLGNRDVVGLEQDNVLVSPSGITRIDFGASLMYRAQGEIKEFTDHVGEISSMRDPDINKQSAEVFGPMSNEEISASIDHVLSIPNAVIMNQVKAHGMPASLGMTLIERKEFLKNYKTFLASPPAGAKLPPEPPAWEAKLEQQKAAMQSQATAAELEKAKKVGAYYPAPTTEYGKQVAETWNEKWATTAAITPEQLEQKVAEYKEAKKYIEAHAASAAAEQEAANAKAKAEQAAKAKAEKAAAKAKEEAESAKHQAVIEEIAAELGLSPSDADQVDTLISLGGGNKAAIVSKFKEFQKSGIGKHGLPLTPFQSAMIQSYVGNAYINANEQLREGVWDMKTHVFAAGIQKGLSKLPGYNAEVKRGFNLINKSDQAKYEVGKIVHWNAFSSCGKQSSFNGNMQCTITPLAGDSTRARDLGPMNPSEAGGEVLYMAHSSFKVVSVSGSPGGTMHVKLQEVETF